MLRFRPQDPAGADRGRVSAHERARLRRAVRRSPAGAGAVRLHQSVLPDAVLAGSVQRLSGRAVPAGFGGMDGPFGRDPANPAAKRLAGGGERSSAADPAGPGGTDGNRAGPAAAFSRDGVRVRRRRASGDDADAPEPAGRAASADRNTGPKRAPAQTG